MMKIESKNTVLSNEESEVSTTKKKFHKEKWIY